MSPAWRSSVIPNWTAHEQPHQVQPVTTYQQTLAEVRAAGLGDLDGWIEVRVSDEPKPVAYFKALTTHCAC